MVAPPVDRAPAERSGRLTAAAFSGMTWSYSSTIGVAVVQAVYVTVMARLLDPRAFGIYAIAMLVINMGNSFARMGLAQAIIQRPSITRDDVRASATAGVALGIAIFAGVWMLAPWISGFFDEPDVIPVLRLMGLHFVFVGAGVTSQGLLRRELRFREVSLVHLTGYVVGYGFVGIGMALAGFGVWSLAGAVLSAHLLQAAGQYSRAPHSLVPTFEVRRFSALYGFGARVSLVTFLEFAGKQLDTFAVGRYSTTAMLGQYSRAFVVVNLPMSQHLSRAITRVMFPGFSRIQADRMRLSRAFLSAQALASMVIFSVGAGLAVAAEEVVLVVLGDQWDVAIRVVPFFAVAVSFNIMTKFAELVCEATAELNKVLAVQVAYLGLLAAGYLAVSGLPGVVPFAAVLAIAEVVRHMAFLILAARVVGIRFSWIVRAYGPAVVTAGTVATTVFAASQLSNVAAIPVVVVLFAEIGLAGLALLVALRFNPFRWAQVELAGRLRAAGLLDRRNGIVRFAIGALVGQRALEATMRRRRNPSRHSS